MFFCLFVLIPTGLPESLSVYFTGMCFIFLALKGGGRTMRGRIVFSAFLKPTHLCSKSSFVFGLSASASSAASASFWVSAFLRFRPNYLSHLSPIISPPLLSSFTFPSIRFSDILSAINALIPPPPNLQFPIYFCPVFPLISFFFPFKDLCNLSFLALWCTVSSAIVISFPFSLSCFYLLHIKSFSSFHLMHSCTLQPAGCLKRLL